MKCPQCGFENPDKSKFCASCGSPMAGAPAGPAPEAKRSGPGMGGWPPPASPLPPTPSEIPEKASGMPPQGLPPGMMPPQAPPPRPPEKPKKSKLKLILGLGIPLLLIIVLVLGFFFFPIFEPVRNSIFEGGNGDAYTDGEDEDGETDDEEDEDGDNDEDEEETFAIDPEETVEKTFGALEKEDPFEGSWEGRVYFNHYPEQAGGSSFLYATAEKELDLKLLISGETAELHFDKNTIPLSLEKDGKRLNLSGKVEEGGELSLKLYLEERHGQDNVLRTLDGEIKYTFGETESKSRIILGEEESEAPDLDGKLNLDLPEAPSTETPSAETALAETSAEKTEPTPEDTAEKPTESEPAETTAEPTESEPAKTTAKPTESKPAETTAKPTESEPAKTTAKPTESKPADTTAKPTESKPADTTAKPTESKPAETTAKPTESEPAETTAKAEPEKEIKAGCPSAEDYATEPAAENEAPLRKAYQSYLSGTYWVCDPLLIPDKNRTNAYRFGSDGSLLIELWERSSDKYPAVNLRTDEKEGWTNIADVDGSYEFGARYDQLTLSFSGQDYKVRLIPMNDDFMFLMMDNTVGQSLFMTRLDGFKDLFDTQAPASLFDVVCTQDDCPIDPELGYAMIDECILTDQVIDSIHPDSKGRGYAQEGYYKDKPLLIGFGESENLDSEEVNNLWVQFVLRDVADPVDIDLFSYYDEENGIYIYDEMIDLPDEFMPENYQGTPLRGHLRMEFQAVSIESEMNDDGMVERSYRLFGNVYLFVNNEYTGPSGSSGRDGYYLRWVFSASGQREVQ